MKRLHRAAPSSILAALALALPLPVLPAAAPAPGQQKSVSELVETLKRNRDESDPALIAELAALRTKAAAEGLIEVFDSMGSNYMRREALKGLVLFDDVPEGQQQALEKIASVAGDYPDREMRMMALDFLAKAPKLGKSFLEKIVESPAEDDVRERALGLHIGLANDADMGWYRSLYDPELIEKAEKEHEKEDKGKKRGRDEDAPKELKLHTLGKIRSMAFGALAAKLDEKDLIKATDDKNGDIRTLALEELDRRHIGKVGALARDAFDNGQNPSRVRLAAAKILVASEGKKIAGELIDVGTKNSSVTPGSLSWGLADLLADMKDESVDKAVAKLVGKGKPEEMIFAMRAAKHIQDEKLVKALRKQLKNKDDLLVSLTVVELGRRKDTESLEDLEKLLDKTKDEELAGKLLDAIGSIHGGSAEWLARLKDHAASPREELRNAAVLQLGRSGKAEYLPLLVKALDHEQWSTRYAALRALEQLRSREAVGAIIARLPQEEGRMAILFADTLFRLTGQPFGKSHGGWKAWWEKEGASFEIISEAELKKRIEEEEERRLKQRSKASFFGIRIESKRVVFIIDISGSMQEELRAKYVGESSGETRIAVAKRELAASIDALERGALFNIIAFNGDVAPWLDSGIAGSSEKTRDEAKEYVEKLGASGGTNLYGAIRSAFEDDQVDAIYILSDGEPSVGDVIDPQAIRADVTRWNEHRGIEINCIAVGGSLQVLEWIAEDNGGSYVKFN